MLRASVAKCWKVRELGRVRLLHGREEEALQGRGDRGERQQETQNRQPDLHPKLPEGQAQRGTSKRARLVMRNSDK